MRQPAPHRTGNAQAEVRHVDEDHNIRRCRDDRVNGGAQPPEPSWGNIVFESQSYFLNAPWLVFFPGAAILLVALSFNVVGDALREALDPTQRGRS